MKKEKLYRYIGYNGTVTSPILLPNTDHLVIYQLTATPGHYLTDGATKVYRANVVEADLDKWVEVKGAID